MSLIKRRGYFGEVLNIFLVSFLATFGIGLIGFAFWSKFMAEPPNGKGQFSNINESADEIEIDEPYGYVGVDIPPMVMGGGASPRSPKWPKVRDAYFKEHPNCEFKGCKNSGKLMNVHHVKPFHLHPELELEPSNLITLCVEPHGGHHLAAGHLGSFKDENPFVREDCEKRIIRPIAIERMSVFKTKLGKTLLAP